MVFKGVIDNVTCAHAYLSVGLKAYLCEQLPACAKFLRPLFIEVHMTKRIRGALPRRRVKDVPRTR